MTRLLQQNLIIALVIPGMFFVITPPALAVQMSDFVWQNRPLLLFAPSEGDARLQQTKRELELRQCDLNDRDMLIGIITEQGQSRLNNQPISKSRAEELRDRYRIEPGQFAAILIGKDGGEKERVDTVPDLDSIFALIDGMPMRQDEMMQSPVDCSGQSQ